MPGNPFQLLADDEEEDLGATVAATQEPAKAVKPSQAPAAKAKAPSSKPAASDNKEKDVAVPKNPAPRQRKPRAPQESSPAVEEQAFEKPKGEARGGRGAHAGHESSGRDGGVNRNERHSHHRVQKVGDKGEKREGHGMGNWGKKDEINADAIEEVKAETAAAEAPAAVVEDAPKDDEPKTVSYDDFKKTIQARRAAVPLPAARKAGEGEDTARWGDAQELVKEDEDEEDAEKASGDRKTQRANKKQTIDINVQFAASERAEAPRETFGGRGGRGGARGGSRGRGNGARGARGGSSRGSDNRAPAAAFNVLEADFPKL